jgi:hypothetical protein
MRPTVDLAYFVSCANLASDQLIMANVFIMTLVSQVVCQLIIQSPALFRPYILPNNCCLVENLN